MNEPVDPFVGLTETAVQHHEMYMSWLNAGFNEQQAMDLLMTFLAEIIAKAVE